MKLLGLPIEGTSSWTEELALLIAEGTAAEARAFVELRRLDAELKEITAQVNQKRSNLDRLRARVTEAAELISVLGAQPPGPWHRRYLPLVVAAIVVLVLSLMFLHGLAVAAGIIVASALVVVARRGRDQEATALTQRRAEAAADHRRLVAELQEATRQVEAVQGVCEELARQRELAKPRKALSAIGRVYVPFRTVAIAGYPLVIDESGATEPVSLRLPDLAANVEVVENVQRAVEGAKTMPVLLSPSGQGPSELGTLAGEERELQQALGAFSDMLQSIPTIEERLPILPKTSALVRYLEEHEETGVASDTPGVLLHARSQDERRAIERITDLAARMRRIGGDVQAVLRGAHQELGAVLETYQGLRSDALLRLHESLEEVLFRSDLAHVNYYCPKCNRVPRYLFHRLGIDIERAHELDPNTLVNALQDDAETRGRIVADEQIINDISQAWMALHELDASIQGWVARMQSSAGQVGPDLTAVRAFDARLRAMRAQRAQLLEQFQAALRKAVTGTARPLLDLSRQARLYLDPDAGHWTCAVCGTVFDDPAVARMGRMLKVKDELLMPMWNHLWTEKDDFRKAELFRTNEQLQRLIEKEAGALREVAEQYRADMRPVRENLIISTTDAMSKREQLETTVHSLSALGVITKTEADGSVERIAAMTGGNLLQMRKHAEQKETLLNQEPQAQMNRRIPALDPVDLFLGPEALFSLDGGSGERVKLPGPGPGRGIGGPGAAAPRLGEAAEVTS